MNALIGHTGFVGSNLEAQAHFDAKFNSRNIAKIAGQKFDLLVCAGAYAVKWKANKDPAADLEGIQKLIEPLRAVSAERFVLISTIDVYPRPEMVDEDTSIDAAGGTPYGKHRWELEQFCRSQFATCSVLRLPGLFGPGLKKNVIYDLMNDNQVEKIHPDGVFQYYSLQHLWRDVNIALERKIPTLNVSCEPIPTRELALRVFGRELTAYPPGAAPAIYDMRSKYAPLWGGAPFGYLYSKERVLKELQEFVERERAL